jgi:hypothetical protein
MDQEDENQKAAAVNPPVLVEDFIKKTVTFNGGEIYWLFEPAAEVLEEWTRRITCALCYAKRFFDDNGVTLPLIPYRVYLSSTYTETKSLLYEQSGGNFILQPNAASGVIKGALFAQQKAKMNDIHEYIHILVDNLHWADVVKDQKRKAFFQPMWYQEGLAQYIQGKKEGLDYFLLARKLEYLPPITLALMNIPSQKLWFEFGIMDYLVLTGNHPGLTAGASFIQFLVEKEGLGFKKIWDLTLFQGTPTEFYRKIEELCQNKFFNILNNYLYYVDKPFLSKEQKTWSMPVAVARDFRGEFAYENKEFELINDVYA